MKYIEDEWKGCYRDGWKGLIVDDAFAHPAKFSRALIRRIYAHAREEGWMVPGSVVVDPFGGVALGAFEALWHGATWIGCELESKFVDLGNRNLVSWDERFGSKDGWGSAQLIQGDSRRLSDVLRDAGLCVSSPPYAEGGVHQKGNQLDSRELKDWRTDKSGGRMGVSQATGYGTTEGNLGNLPATEAGLNLAISSPPYIRALGNAANYADPDKAQSDSQRDIMRANGGASSDKRYSEDPANLGAMKEGDFSLVISSPPYHESLASDDPEKRGGLFRDPKRKNDKSLTATYGQSEGQLGAMKESSEGFSLAVGSPPFADSLSSGSVSDSIRDDLARRGHKPSASGERADYGESPGQLGAMRDKGFDLSVSSPPWEAGAEGGLRKEKFKDPVAFAAAMEERARKSPSRYHGRSASAHLAQMERDADRTYGDTEGNVGNQQGQDFWTAARQIVEETYKVLAPNAHAVWVCKRFVRKGKIVNFSEQWAQLCEAVGFRVIHWHRASLIEQGTQQQRMDGGIDDNSVARKSFFRRLHERKHPETSIDWEDVICMLKPK